MSTGAVLRLRVGNSAMAAMLRTYRWLEMLEVRTRRCIWLAQGASLKIARLAHEATDPERS